MPTVETMYVIVGTTDNERDPETGEMLYWSNDWGWVDEDMADLFTNEEKNWLSLPIGGKWEEV